MIFRKATPNDIPAIAQIYSDIHTAEESGAITTGWIRSIYPTAQTAEQAILRDDLYVQEDGEEIVGAAIINQQQVDVYAGAPWEYPAADEDVLVLHTLVISPASSGKGFGPAFVRFYESCAQAQNCHYLRIDTNARNTRARAMYKKLGFREIAIVPCIFNGLPDINLVLLEKKVAEI